MKGKSILVACNDLDYILMSKVLCSEYLLERVVSNENIADCSNAEKYALVMLDPGFLGARNCKMEDFVSKFPSSVPVAILTADPYGTTRSALRKTGCCDFFLKPIRQQELIDFVHKWADK